MDIKRKVTKKIKIANTYIGGDSDILVQSMLSTDSEDAEKSLSQALELQNAGCEMVRLAILNMNSVKTIASLKENISIPVVADIHFDYKLALESISAGVDKIRINPGNIGSNDRIKAVANACKQKEIPIRIGVNSGSLEKHILAKYGSPTAEALVESADYHIKLLENFDFDDVLVSIKSSNVKRMVDSYRLFSSKYAYPLHLGVTEAGTEHMGMIKSSIGIGSLLLDGIGDTIRVSLTADPVSEIYAAYDILKAAGARKRGVTLISCPTCGRTKINLIKLANEVEEKLKDSTADITVAVMGCAVNGPGEAREADIGIAGGDGVGLIFKKGEIIKKVPETELLNELLAEVNRMSENNG